MEGDVVLRHELDITHVVRALVGAPPALPGVVALPCRLGPFRRGADVFDGRVEPDIEDLTLHPRPVLAALLHRDAPVEVAGDRPVLQAVAVMQPFLGDGGRQHRPARLAVDPLVQMAPHRGLAEVKVLRLPHLKIGGAGDRGAGLDQVGRVELFGAVLALVAARLVVAAVRARPLDIAVRQEAPVGIGIDLFLHHLVDQTGARQTFGEMLG